jgi:ABC-type Co2+ transport system permease subunit
MTLEDSAKFVVPEIPVVTGSCVSPIGTTAEVVEVDDIDTHGQLREG